MNAPAGPLAEWVKFIGGLSGLISGLTLIADRLLGSRPTLSAIRRRRDMAILEVANRSSRTIFVDRAMLWLERGRVSKHPGFDDILGHKVAERALAPIVPGETLEMTLVAVDAELKDGWMVVVVFWRRGALPAVPLVRAFRGAILKRLPDPRDR